MVKIQINDKNIYYDGWLYNEFLIIKNKIIKQDWDWITFIDGMEGSGKSTLAQQLALLCDNSFNIDRICFTPEDFVNKVIAAEKYQALIFDEAYGAIASARAINKVCKIITSLLAQIRQKNLFIFIVAPTFFDIARNIALWRSKALIHVYLGQGYERGFWRAFTYNKKNRLYVLGKKLYNYNAMKISAKGRFTKQLVVDDAEYREKKLKALTYFEEDTKPASNAMQQRNGLIKYLHNTYNLKAKDIAEIFIEYNIPDITERHISYILQKLNITY